MGGFFLGIYRTPWSFNPQIQGGSGQFSHQPSLIMVAGWDVPAQYHRVNPISYTLVKEKYHRLVAWDGLRNSTLGKRRGRLWAEHSGFCVVYILMSGGEREWFRKGLLIHKSVGIFLEWKQWCPWGVGLRPFTVPAQPTGKHICPFLSLCFSAG